MSLSDLKKSNSNFDFLQKELEKIANPEKELHIKKIHDTGEPLLIRQVMVMQSFVFFLRLKVKNYHGCECFHMGFKVRQVVGI